MKLRLISWFMLPFLAISLHAQQLKGKITSTEKESLIGAIVQWEGSSTGSATNEEGWFALEKKDTAANLLIRYVGYKPLSLRVEPSEDTVWIQMSGITQLSTVEIAASHKDQFVSTLETRAVETITSRELRKAPCCNLSESFETNGSVDVTYSDGVTGAREIQMLGLRGIYTQMMIENRPALSGLSAPFALEYIPGTWLESIQISKGTGSVVNGYQSITGQINAELVKPFRDKRIFINLYGDATGRGEVNLHLNHKFNPHWSTGLLLHGDYYNAQRDLNKDGFMDVPRKQQINGLYRLFYDGDIFCAQFNVHALSEKRNGGQVVPDLNAPPSNYFRVNQDAQRMEIFAKLGYKGFEKPYMNLGSQFSTLWHQTSALLGNTNYHGTQQQFYGNLIYSTILATTDHKVTFGATYLFDRYTEQFNDQKRNRTESIPGVYGEYTYDHLAKNGEKNLSLILGFRADYHNLYGMLLTPRVHLKYNPAEHTTLRLAAGRGLRTANVIMENIGLLANNREWVIAPDLKMEDAWNGGLNVTQEFHFAGKEGSVSADIYHTRFVNQVIVDMDEDFRKIQFYNLSGASYSNSLLLSSEYNIFKGLHIKLVYKFNDVWITYQTGLRRQPLVPIHRGLAVLEYQTPDKKWMFNTSVQWTGQQRMPDHSQIPHDYVHDIPAKSPSYTLFNAQITRKFGKLDLYGGAENIGNYTQRHPIIAANEPFSQYFDASQVYAPLLGTRIYMGVRWGLD